MARILIADDEPTFRAFLADVLEGAGHEVLEVGDGEAALVALGREPFDLVLSDQRMPRLDGLGLVRRLGSLAGAPRVVLITAFGTIPDAVEAVRLGAADYLTKPLPSPQALLAVVERVLGPDTPEADFVTASPTVLDLLDLVDRVAGRDIPVLVSGESGTGKELIARRLHARSGRAGGPFVAVNCAALPETLAESELFGHERGAFTGAEASRAGRFEEAHGGTLLLDEIGELALPLQAKLLRVLETRMVRRLGGSSEREVDVRLVAATNRTLEAEVDAGRFRRDLYFRLAVVSVALPPLRERPADIPLLARHLLSSLATRHRLAAPALAEDALDALLRYGWPGNVRELRNVLERALVVGNGETIRAVDLALHAAGPPPVVPLAREARERAAVLEALRQSGGNREAAARLLGVSVRTLYYRLRNLGIG